MSGLPLKRLIKEPLLHFLILGFLLFLIYDFRQEQAVEAPDRIVVTSSQIYQLSARFKLSKLRSPTVSELDAIIEAHIREEVFYREALAMGLDQNDTQVRNRMRVKLEYLLEELSTDNPSDEVLMDFFKQYPDRFKSDSQYSFQQIFIDPANHQDANSQANKLLQQLNEAANSESLGDKTILPPEFALMSSREIDNYLGAGVAKQLEPFVGKKWAGPIASSYGLHLVKIDQYIEGPVPEFSRIRDVVERDYIAHLRDEQKHQAYQLMRKRYQIAIEPVAISKTKAN